MRQLTRRLPPNLTWAHRFLRWRQVGAIGGPGDMLILEMGGPIRFMDLAKQLIKLMNPSLTVEVAGLRPGEKLHQILVASDEVGVAKVYPRIIHASADLADSAVVLETTGPDVVAKFGQLLREHPADSPPAYKPEAV